MPVFSGDVVIFAKNKAGWARFICLVFFATFVRLMMTLMSTHTI